MNITSFIVLCFFGVLSFASSHASYELSCRAKAKEVAADTYRTCVTENKSAEIDRLKRDYKERLRNLKDDYEVEVAKLGLKKSKKSLSHAIEKEHEHEVERIENRKKRNADADDSQMDLPEPIPVELENQNSL